MDLYIYYRVRCDHAPEFQACALNMQAILGKECHVTTALKRQSGEKDNHHTWMEVYQNVPENFDTILQQAVKQAGLPSHIVGERTTEHFMDISTCA